MFSGKSTVAAELAKLGCKVIDADKIAHEILQKMSVRDEIVGLFGQTVLDSAGKIERRKLAQIVFGDGRKLSSLNNIIHPLVLERTEELIEEYGRQGPVKAIVLDMPLLVEVGWADRCDRLIFVDCKEQLRLDRARKMGLFDDSQIKIRENFQNSLDSKVCLADNIINNNSDVSTLVRQVADLFSNIVNSQ
ncbi:MAG: dephospho-CoA kinase [Phycisphaerales bacterium]|nr:MAG: dephospho-CoA kinase [Phycisphaerales bacterium]